MGARILAIAVASAAMALSAGAAAFPSSRLVYARESGAEGCPDEGVLRKAVVDRLGYDPFFPWADATIVARISAAKAGFKGSVELLDKAGMIKGARELEAKGSQCNELISSMALAISIAIDPQSLDRGGAPPAEPNREPEPPAEFWKGAPEPDQPPPPRPASKASSKGPRIQGEVYAQFVAVTGFAPGPAFGPGIGVSAHYGAWSAGVEGRYQFATIRDVDQGSLASSVLDVALPVCGHFAPFFGCGLFDAGVLFVEGRGVSSPRSETAVVLRAGPRAGVEWPIAGRLGLRAHADLAFNLTRPDVVLDGGDAWSAPLVAALGGISVFGLFP